MAFVLPQLVTSQYFVEVYGGYTLSKMRLPSEIDTKINPTYYPTIGVGIIRTVSPKVAAKFSTNLVSKGFIAEETERSDRAKYRLHYLSLAPALEYRLTSRVESRFGLSIERLISTHRSSSNGAWEDMERYNFFKNLEFGIFGELGYQIQQFYLMASYTHGVNNTAANNWTDLNGNAIINPRAYNRLFKLAISYRIKL